MRIALGQFAPTASVKANLVVIEDLAVRAADGGAELLVLPEQAMYNGDDDPEAAPDPTDPLDPSQTGPALAAADHWEDYVERIAETARRLGLALVAPGYEPGPAGLPYNTMLVVDSQGEELARYRKMHLYDAFSYQESRSVMRGDVAPTVLELDGFTIGLVNCYDLRFPELSRVLVELGAQVLVVSAAWMDGPHKVDHWRTLLRARAIENTCWVVASGCSGSACVGTSMAVDPLGVVTAELADENPGLAFVEVTNERLDEVRFTVPVLRNRRILIHQS